MIATWSEGVADENMPEEILVELAGIIRRHPWWRARARLTLSLLQRLDVRPPARILDAGCGWGVTLDLLEQQGYQATGMDISKRTLEHLDRPGRELVLADLTQPLPDGVEPYDAVLALDVIEHLDDDQAAVERFGALTKPGGLVIVSVPALPEMYTEFDKIQGHRRRYLPETLRAAFEGTQPRLELEQVFWWGRWLLPMLRRQRGQVKSTAGESAAQVYQRYLKIPPWPIPLGLSLGLSLAFALEHRPTLDHKLQTGTSLFAVARRSVT
ncbi:class I SAM-dependent methyltransferase [soil metagenome]